MDGFQSTTTKYKDCWVVEVEVLNGGKENLQHPIPVIFIPASLEKLLRGTGEEVMTAFLEPLMKELECVFIKGFEVLYNFPPELIFEGLSPLSGTGDLKLRAMLIYWTGDHPAQTKVAGFKTSGYNACRRHYNVVEKVVGAKTAPSSAALKGGLLFVTSPKVPCLHFV